MAFINNKKVLTVVRTDHLNIMDVYPIGSIYMSINNTNPSTLFGGTWEQMSNSQVYIPTSTTAEIVQTETNILIDETSGQKVQIYTDTSMGAGDSADAKLYSSSANTSTIPSHASMYLNTDVVKVSLSAISVYMWKRTA